MSGPAALGWPASCRIWRVCEKRVFLPGAARSAGLRSCPDGCVIVPGFPGLSRHSGSPASPVHAPSRLIGAVAHACTDACGAGMRSCLERRASPDGETVAGTENLSVGHHVVQFYGHDEELAERVAAPGGAPGRGGRPAAGPFASPRAAPAAPRHFTVAMLHAWGAGDLAGDAALAVTELAANAIVHAHSAFTIVLSARDDLLRISVRDASPLRGAGLAPAPLHGLGMVDALARRWGVESLGSAGKLVWVDLRR